METFQVTKHDLDGLTVEELTTASKLVALSVDLCFSESSKVQGPAKISTLYERPADEFGVGIIRTYTDVEITNTGLALTVRRHFFMAGDGLKDDGPVKEPE